MGKTNNQKKKFLHIPNEQSELPNKKTTVVKWPKKKNRITNQQTVLAFFSLWLCSIRMSLYRQVDKNCWWDTLEFLSFEMSSRWCHLYIETILWNTSSLVNVSLSEEKTNYARQLEINNNENIWSSHSDMSVVEIERKWNFSYSPYMKSTIRTNILELGIWY